MARYLLESPHTKEECLKAMDEILTEGPSILNKYEWGCAAGDHAGYALIEADNESAVRNMVPSFLRNKARIVKVGKFTPEQIKSLH